MENNSEMVKSNWKIDLSHSKLGFKVKHFMIAYVRGSFNDFKASIYTIKNDFKTAEVELSIDAESIDTGDIRRDEHLKSVEFLDVQHHKQISFVLHSIERTESKMEYCIWGDLQIRGISHRIKLDATFGGIIKDPHGVERAGFSIKGKFNRSDYSLIWNSAIERGGFMVGEEVHLMCELELIKTRVITDRQEVLELVLKENNANLMRSKK